MRKSTRRDCFGFTLEANWTIILFQVERFLEIAASVNKRKPLHDVSILNAEKKRQMNNWVRPLESVISEMYLFIKLEPWENINIFIRFLKYQDFHQISKCQDFPQISKISRFSSDFENILIYLPKFSFPPLHQFSVN